MNTLSIEQLEEIEKNPDNQDWDIICRDYKLSEDFIDKYQDKIDWVCVCVCMSNGIYVYCALLNLVHL